MRASTEKKGRVYGGRGARERQRERRRQFMDAGLACFGTRGFANTTVKQLCAEAGLTERYLYESFANREQLFIEVAAECVTGLMGSLALAKSRSTGSPAEQIDGLVEAFFRWFRDDPRRVRIQLIDPILISPVTQETYTEVTRVFIHFARDAAMEWYALSLADRRVDADLMATMLVGGLIEVAKEWAGTGFERSLEEVVETASLPFHGLSLALSTRQKAP